MYVVIYGIKGGHISSDLTIASQVKEYKKEVGVVESGRQTLCGKYVNPKQWSVINTKEDTYILKILCKTCVSKLRNTATQRS